MTTLNRRDFLKLTAAVSTASLTGCQSQMFASAPTKRPNIILCMSDDMGWGDVGYNGNQHIKTPNLDDMAKSGIRFDRWYAGAPVCSPTRGSCVTGRHPYRYGIFYANQGHIKSEEVTLAEALKTQGYTTGHFGKWHLGTLTKTFKEGRRGGRPSTNKHYSPPWENGFDECFSTEMSVPTWDPMENQNIPAHFWVGPGKHLPFDDASLKGDGSRVIMDRAIPFIQKSSRQNTPFLAVIWFFAPHNPVVAGPKYKAMYSEYDDDKQHYYGCITALDEQVGRLREELKAAGIADNTMLWFCSDNGPAGKGGGGAQYPGGRMQGVAGPFRGRKGSLYEGGVRVPGMLEWPDKIKKAHVIKDFPCSTSDYFPTTMEVLGFKMKGQPETIDGISLLPLIEGKMKQRATPIGFESKNQVSLPDNQYKIYSSDSGTTFELYDLLSDPCETTNIASQHPDIVNSMKTKLFAWRNSCTASNKGRDYPAGG